MLYSCSGAGWTCSPGGRLREWCESDREKMGRKKFKTFKWSWCCNSVPVCVRVCVSLCECVCMFFFSGTTVCIELCLCPQYNNLHMLLFMQDSSRSL